MNAILYKEIAEAAEAGAVGHVVLEAEAYEVAERDAVVDSFLDSGVAGEIPCADQFYAEEHEAVVARATCRVALSRVETLYN